MAFYLYNILAFFLYSAFFSTIKKFNKKIYYWVTILHFSLIMGLRSYTVGTDTSQYVFYYQNQTYNLNNNTIIYSLINNTFWHFFNSNYHYFIFFLSFITIYLIYKSIILFGNGDENFFMSFAIYLTYYYYFESFNMQRQMLAVALAMFSMSLLQNKRILSAIIVMLVAIGIHNTALMAVIGFVVWRIPKTKKALLFISSFVILGTTLFGKLFNIFSGLFSHYNMYSNYLNNSKYAAGGGSILLGIFLVFMIIIGSKESKILSNMKWGFAIFMTQIGGLLYIIGGHSQLLVRMAVYFTIYSIISLPILIDGISKRFVEYKIISFALSFVTLSIGMMLLIYKISNNLGDIVPYVFIK